MLSSDKLETLMWSKTVKLLFVADSREVRVQMFEVVWGRYWFYGEDEFNEV